jgi:4a-hydroxytetrahydrobiopterin dehydratase
MTELAKKKCVPCEGGVSPLEPEQIKEYQKEVHKDWEVLDNTKIKRDFAFVNFIQTMEVANKIADIAEEQGHHPDMHISYGKLQVELWTHAINGLSENDFILASKIDKI